MPLQNQQGKRRTVAQDVPVKRFRVSRACDQCRTERSKCDGNQPQCAPCFDSNRDCTYTSNPKKRGLPPGYIRGIELALALVCQQNPEVEASLITSLGQENTVLLARDTRESNRLHKSWRKSKLCKELNKRLTGDQTAIANEEPLSSGEDSDDKAEQDTSPTSLLSGASRRIDQPLPELDRPISQRPGTQRVMEHGNLTPLPTNCWQLLETYSTYTQCWLPISEKLDILKLSYSYPSHGLQLLPDMPESGHHAEMWSILTLSSCQNISEPHAGPRDGRLMSSGELYTITRSLIPTELGNFQVGHAKALLNLALVNLRSSLYDAAWILVGAAMRGVTTIENSARPFGSRYVHVVASCYVLDGLLALSLNRRPYFQKSDIERAGIIEEDGLEEWQPWVGELNTASGHTSRLPTLALSSFNRLVELIDILVLAGQNPTARNDAFRQLMQWKAALPSKFEYLQLDSISVPSTPPAVLLQLTHFATIFTCTPSHTCLQRILDSLELCQSQLGPNKLPYIVSPLLRWIKQLSRNLALENDTQTRIEKALDNFTAVTDRETVEILRPIRAATHSSYVGEQDAYLGTSQVSPQSFHNRFHQPIPARQQGQAHPTSLLEDLLPDMNTTQQVQTTFSPNPVNTDFTSPAIDAYDPSISGDLENFFDELASLHGAKKLQNQPQFMQNLGFAPEVSMADLLATQSGQFMPLNPSTFGTDHEGEPLQFPLSDYYDAG